MLTIIAYDISENKRRSKLAKALEDFGFRVQYSIFEADLDEKKLENLKERVMGIINLEEDRVRFYHLCGKCNNLVEKTGVAEVNMFKESFIV